MGRKMQKWCTRNRPGSGPDVLRKQDTSDVKPDAQAASAPDERVLMSSTSQKRAAALMEVLGVYLAGPILMLGLRRLFGISLPNPLNTLTVNTSDPGLVIASRQLFLLLLIQNAGYYVFAAPLN